jgi:hypothetical protein
MLCADLVDMTWRDKGGRLRSLTANLEDISLCGACVQTDVPVPLEAEVEISYPKGELSGVVRYCIFRDVGYFVGLEFASGCRWSKREFKPQHMLDPRRLVARALSRQRREQP